MIKKQLLFVTLFSFVLCFVQLDVNSVEASKNVEKKDIEITKDFEVDFESEYEEYDDYLRDGIEEEMSRVDSENNEVVDDNTITPYFNKVHVRFVNIVKLAKGQSNLSFSGKKVNASGSTKGLKLTTVTSATNSVKNMNTGKITKGKKKTAVSKATSKSSVSINKSKKTSGYGSLTIHTATNQGVLYKRTTATFGVY